MLGFWICESLAMRTSLRCELSQLFVTTTAIFATTLKQLANNLRFVSGHLFFLVILFYTSPLPIQVVLPHKDFEGIVSHVNSSNKHSIGKEVAKETSTRTIVLSWLAVVIMAGVIFWMSANTGTSINQGLGIISTLKAFLSSVAFSLVGHEVDVSPIGHFVEYFIFGILLLNALRFHMPLSRAVLFAIIIGSAYGVTDEIHQYFVPERSCDPMDWLVDSIAVALGALLCRLAARKQLFSRKTKDRHH
jgi:VanZ family protein